MSDRSEAFPNLPGWGFPLHLPLSVKAQGGGIDGDKVVSLVESERARWVDLFEKRGQVGLDAEAKYLVGRLDQLEALFHSVPPHGGATSSAPMGETHSLFSNAVVISSIISGVARSK